MDVQSASVIGLLPVPLKRTKALNDVNKPLSPSASGWELPHDLLSINDTEEIMWRFDPVLYQ